MIKMTENMKKIINEELSIEEGAVKIIYGFNKGYYFKMMKAFCEASDLVKKRILIACGYKGITLSNYMNGERLFYGSKGRWDVIFITDRNRKNSALL